MALVIDGYNLMHAIGLLDQRRGPHVLEKARLTLLNTLAESLDPAELPHTTVVFDAKDVPRHVPDRLEHRGICVRFAAEEDEADELIEELIRTDSVPRRLTVVSSDHRLQTAARRRRARFADSEAWWDALLAERRQRQQALPQSVQNEENSTLEARVDWRDQFESQVLKEAQQLVDELNEDRPLPRTSRRENRTKRKR